MNPGPAKILSCPYCGGTKEVMTLISGNTIGGTVWSDTRRHYPMLPEVSPIQKCPHCGKYYFIEQAKSQYADDYKHCGELGTLNYSELKEAKEQMEHLTLSPVQRWIVNHLLFMAYNDEFRRMDGENTLKTPTDEDQQIFATTIEALLEGMNSSKDYNLFHAELLRESGRFDEAKGILMQHDNEDDRWVVESMIQHIDKHDTLPFLLIHDGEKAKI